MNPLEKIELRDIFDKDPENYTEKDREVVLKYYRDWLIKFREAKDKKEKKKADSLADIKKMKF